MRVPTRRSVTQRDLGKLDKYQTTCNSLACRSPRRKQSCPIRDGKVDTLRVSVGVWANSPVSSVIYDEGERPKPEAARRHFPTARRISLLVETNAVSTFLASCLRFWPLTLAGAGPACTDFDPVDVHPIVGSGIAAFLDGGDGDLGLEVEGLNRAVEASTGFGEGADSCHSDSPLVYLDRAHRGLDGRDQAARETAAPAGLQHSGRRQ